MLLTYLLTYYGWSIVAKNNFDTSTKIQRNKFNANEFSMAVATKLVQRQRISNGSANEISSMPTNFQWQWQILCINCCTFSSNNFIVERKQTKLVNEIYIKFYHLVCIL